MERFEIHDEAELPQPKAAILRDLLDRISLETDLEARERLADEAMVLAQYQPGVGAMIQKFGHVPRDAALLPEDRLIDLAIETQSGCMRWIETVPAVEADARRIAGDINEAAGMDTVLIDRVIRKFRCVSDRVEHYAFHPEDTLEHPRWLIVAAIMTRLRTGEGRADERRELGYLVQSISSFQPGIEGPLVVRADNLDEWQDIYHRHLPERIWLQNAAKRVMFVY